MRPFGNERGFSDACSPQFLIGVTATALCAPAIIRVAALMPIRGIPLLSEIPNAGYVERLYLDGCWDAQRVAAVIERDRLVRKGDARVRADRANCDRPS
jgi:hypothetical protein